MESNNGLIGPPVPFYFLRSVDLFVVVRSLVLASPYLSKADGLQHELSRFTLSVEHFLLDRIESQSAVYVFKHFIGVDIFFISASSGLLRTGYIWAFKKGAST